MLYVMLSLIVLGLLCFVLSVGTIVGSWFVKTRHYFVMLENVTMGSILSGVVFFVLSCLCGIIYLP